MTLATNEMLSQHFSFEEAITSETAARKGIENIPDHNTLVTMYATANKLERVRALLAVPLHINSWFRCVELNSAIGSKNTSQHIKGEAVDFIAPTFGTPFDICKKILEYKDLINFDQLILEHTWVHISSAILSGKPRNQVLSLLAGGGYSQGLTDKTGKQLM